MLTGDQIRKARERADLTQAALGELVGVSMRSIGNYERGETIPLRKMPRIEEVLSPYLDTGSEGPALAGASDAELLAEIARRFERGRHVPSNTRAPVSGASEPTTVEAEIEEGYSELLPEEQPAPPGDGREQRR